MSDSHWYSLYSNFSLKDYFFNNFSQWNSKHNVLLFFELNLNCVLDCNFESIISYLKYVFIEIHKQAHMFGRPNILERNILNSWKNYTEYFDY
jgi:hypothetical protein